MEKTQFTQSQLIWIYSNRLLFTSSITWDKPRLTELFNLYSYLTGKVEKPVGCGRCVATARDRVWTQYKKQQDDIKEINN